LEPPPAAAGEELAAAIERAEQAARAAGDEPAIASLRDEAARARALLEAAALTPRGDRVAVAAALAPLAESDPERVLAAVGVALVGSGDAALEAGLAKPSRAADPADAPLAAEAAVDLARADARPGRARAALARLDELEPRLHDDPDARAACARA